MTDRHGWILYEPVAESIIAADMTIRELFCAGAQWGWDARRDDILDACKWQEIPPGIILLPATRRLVEEAAGEGGPGTPFVARDGLMDLPDGASIEEIDDHRAALRRGSRASFLDAPPLVCYSSL